MKCELCGSIKQLQKHHKFSQNKVNKRLYGDLVHDERNLIILCVDCHLSKPVPKWSELQFCKALGVEPRSKEYQARKLR